MHCIVVCYSCITISTMFLIWVANGGINGCSKAFKTDCDLRWPCTRAPPRSCSRSFNQAHYNQASTGCQMHCLDTSCEVAFEGGHQSAPAVCTACTDCTSAVQGKTHASESCGASHPILFLEHLARRCVCCMPEFGSAWRTSTVCAALDDYSQCWQSIGRGHHVTQALD